MSLPIPDLDLTDTPKDCLLHVTDCLQRFPQLGKIGLGLSITDVPPQSPYFRHVNTVEARYWQLPLIEGRVREAPVDTTFAIHHKSMLDQYRVCGPAPTPRTPRGTCPGPFASGTSSFNITSCAPMRRRRTSRSSGRKLM
jgi:hypothetical protein